jgi:hypothetical protein
MNTLYERLKAKTETRLGRPPAPFLAVSPRGIEAGLCFMTQRLDAGNALPRIRLNFEVLMLRILTTDAAFTRVRGARVARASTALLP